MNILDEAKKEAVKEAVKEIVKGIVKAVTEAFTKSEAKAMPKTAVGDEPLRRKGYTVFPPRRQIKLNVEEKKIINEKPQQLGKKLPRSFKNEEEEKVYAYYQGINSLLKECQEERQQRNGK